MKLGELKKGTKGRIVSLSDQDFPEGWIDRLMEMGFLEGSRVEVLHEAPLGGNPIAVRVRGTLVALRREEANAIEVSVEGE